MKHRHTYAALLLTLFLALSAQARTLTGRVVRVHDGDTFTLKNKRNQETVRLLAIDAPELKQDFGVEARRHLSELLLGKSVRVIWSRRDGRGRPVGRVFVERSDQSLRLLRKGSAWYSAQYAIQLPPRDRERYQRALDDARLNKRGLWAAEHPLPPAEWRASH